MEATKRHRSSLWVCKRQGWLGNHVAFLGRWTACRNRKRGVLVRSKGARGVWAPRCGSRLLLQVTLIVLTTTVRAEMKLRRSLNNDSLVRAQTAEKNMNWKGHTKKSSLGFLLRSYLFCGVGLETDTCNWQKSRRKRLWKKKSAMPVFVFKSRQFFRFCPVLWAFGLNELCCGLGPRRGGCISDGREKRRCRIFEVWTFNSAISVVLTGRSVGASRKCLSGRQSP